MHKHQHIHPHIETPSFIKTDSKNQDDCDFSDDLIDEHIGISMVPVMVSPRQNFSQQQSMCRALKSIENIQNTYLHNNLNHNSKNQQSFNNFNQKHYHKKNNKFENVKCKQSKLSNNKSQSRLEQNIQQHLLKKQKKIKDLKQILQNKQMKQCTFTPNSHLRDKKDKSQKRNLQQFLKNQSEYVTKIQKKKQDLKKKAEQNKRVEQSFRPKINKNQKSQLQYDRKKKPAHQRLYLLKQNKQNKNYVDEQPKKLKTKSKNQSSHINLNKSLTPKKTAFQQKVATPNTLYEDAQRRQNFAKSIDKSKQPQNIQPSYQKNRNNEKFSAQKFIKQYCYVLQCLKLLPTSIPPSCYTSVDAELSFIQNSITNQRQQKKDELSKRQFTNKQFNGILRGLGFLIYEQSSENQLAYQEKSLAYQGFEILQQYGVNIRNLCVFLLSILGIFNVNPINFYDSISVGNQSNQFQISQKQGRKIHQHFDLLYRNHLNTATKTKKILHNKQNYSHSPYSHTHQSNSSHTKFISPRHNEHTKQLATKYRTKMIQRANQRFITNNIDIVLPTQDMLTHEDLLVIDNLGRNLEMKKIKQDKDNYIDKQCTFHPKINNNQHGQSVCWTDRGLQKSKQLYEYARNKQQMEKHHASTNQNNKQQEIYKQLYKKQNAIFIKNDRKISNNKNLQNHYINNVHKTQQSTQRLNHMKTQPQRQNTCENVHVRDVDKAVARMALGRKQRQFKNKLLQRGQPDFSQKKQTQKTSKISPINPHQTSTFSAHHNLSTNTFTITDRQLAHQNLQQYYQSQNQPFLVIDVNMGEQVGQIQFYTGDQKRVGNIVDQFCTQHDLDQQCKQQLLQLVQVEMLKYLNNIGAESTEC